MKRPTRILRPITKPSEKAKSRPESRETAAIKSPAAIFKYSKDTYGLMNKGEATSFRVLCPSVVDLWLPFAPLSTYFANYFAIYALWLSLPIYLFLNTHYRRTFLSRIWLNHLLPKKLDRMFPITRALPSVILTRGSLRRFIMTITPPPGRRRPKSFPTKVSSPWLLQIILSSRFLMSYYGGDERPL